MIRKRYFSRIPWLSLWSRGRSLEGYGSGGPVTAFFLAALAGNLWRLVGNQWKPSCNEYRWRAGSWSVLTLHCHIWCRKWGPGTAWYNFVTAGHLCRFRDISCDYQVWIREQQMRNLLVLPLEQLARTRQQRISPLNYIVFTFLRELSIIFYFENSLRVCACEWSTCWDGCRHR
jgi:hypothetical protein